MLRLFAPGLWRIAASCGAGAAGPSASATGVAGSMACSRSCSHCTAVVVVAARAWSEQAFKAGHLVAPKPAVAASFTRVGSSAGQIAGTRVAGLAEERSCFQGSC